MARRCSPGQETRPAARELSGISDHCAESVASFRRAAELVENGHCLVTLSRNHLGGAPSSPPLVQTSRASGTGRLGAQGMGFEASQSDLEMGRPFPPFAAQHSPPSRTGFQDIQGQPLRIAWDDSVLLGRDPGHKTLSSGQDEGRRRTSVKDALVGCLIFGTIALIVVLAALGGWELGRGR